MSNAPVGHAAGAVPPIELQQARRWLHWAAEPRVKRDGSTVIAKVPYYATGGRRYGDLESDQAKLVTYAEANTALALYGSTRAGLGFALGAGWQGIDLDKIGDRPTLAPLVPDLPGYVEASPSGAGVHAIGYGPSFPTLGSNASGIEAYAAGRFFTFTGRQINGSHALADLSGFVVGRLAPLHALGRRAPGALLERPVIEGVADRTVTELADALRYLDADDRDTWIGVGQELVSLGEIGYRLWAAWSGTASRFPGGDDLERWKTFKGERTSFGGVFNRAEELGWVNPRRLNPAAIFAGSTLVAPQATVAPPAPSAAPVVPPVPNVPAERMGGQKYLEEGGKQREASIENVIDAIGPTSGMVIAYDTFQDAKMIGTPSGGFRPLDDVDLVTMRAQLGRGGFKQVKPEIMRSAVDYVASQRTIDTAIEWCKALPAWDGVPRIDTAMHRYYGCEDNLYTRAVGAYLFTALAGRVMEPGCQADMALILVGLQGARKTSIVAALAPTPESFGVVNLAHRDDNLARKLRGKLVVEWAEMRGMRGRDLEGIKAWITNRTEEWVAKYKEYAIRFKRRCVIVGTANDHELLDDPTGERRWLPVRTGRTDDAGLKHDLHQLWAEGLARWQAGGIEWELAETLAKDQHGAFKVHDEWTELVTQWLDATPVPRFGEAPVPIKNGQLMFPLHKLAEEALRVTAKDLTDLQSKRIGNILRNLGYEKKDVRVDGLVCKRWKQIT